MSAKSLDAPEASRHTATDHNGKEARTMTIAQKKFAIEGALTPYLSEAHLVRAIRIWEEKYSGQPTFALQRFINEFCDNATLMAQRSQILQSLIRALSGADGRPLEQSIFQRETPAAPTSPVVMADGLVDCFSQLMEAVFTNMPGDMHVRARLFLLENLPGMKLPALSQRSLQAWLSQQYRIPSDVILEEKTLRHLVNLVYISLCEFMGPVKADKLLHEAVITTERSCRFPVRQLL